jgi:hypothetical protein
MSATMKESGGNADIKADGVATVCVVKFAASFAAPP